MGGQSEHHRPPSVDSLARALADSSGLPHSILVDIARSAVAEGGDRETIEERAESIAREFSGSLIGEVINATGVLLHTNLGRAPSAMGPPGRPVSIEYDKAAGRRGSRHDPISKLVSLLTGAEAAVVVNNNAAAVLLALAALAEGREVAVSRGESVEIGGGFRVPDVMARSGARLVDVGTTNRTRLDDYRAVAVDPDRDIALLMRVHSSNFEMTGFVESTPVAELVTLGVPVFVDLGSGLLDSNAPWLSAALRPLPTWISAEPAVKQTLDDGADLVAFSGDKLLGGPQCGILAGRADLVERCASHPLMRAFRPGHHILMPLQETLLAYLRRDVTERIPFWSMASVAPEDLAARASVIVDAAGMGTVIRSDAVVGAGAAPGATIESRAVAIDGDITGALRGHTPIPVIARIVDGRTVIDLRSVPAADDPMLIEALRAIRV